MGRPDSQAGHVAQHTDLTGCGQLGKGDEQTGPAHQGGDDEVVVQPRVPDEDAAAQQAQANENTCRQVSRGLSPPAARGGVPDRAVKTPDTTSSSVSFLRSSQSASRIACCASGDGGAAAMALVPRPAPDSRVTASVGRRGISLGDTEEAHRIPPTREVRQQARRMPGNHGHIRRGSWGSGCGGRAGLVASS